MHTSEEAQLNTLLIQYVAVVLIYLFAAVALIIIGGWGALGLWVLVTIAYAAVRGPLDRRGVRSPKSIMLTSLARRTIWIWMSAWAISLAATQPLAALVPPIAYVILFVALMLTDQRRGLLSIMADTERRRDASLRELRAIMRATPEDHQRIAELRSTVLDLSAKLP